MGLVGRDLFASFNEALDDSMLHLLGSIALDDSMLHLLGSID